jgi:hypothetical protein
MININISLRNPFSNKFENIFCKSIKLTQHKSAEVECISSNSLFEFGFSVDTHCDHGGVSVTFGLLGYSILANISDGRHWNAAAGRYYAYDKNGKKL